MFLIRIIFQMILVIKTIWSKQNHFFSGYFFHFFYKTYGVIFFKMFNNIERDNGIKTFRFIKRINIMDISEYILVMNFIFLTFFNTWLKNINSFTGKYFFHFSQRRFFPAADVKDGFTV